MMNAYTQTLRRWRKETSRSAIVAAILLIALVGFEIFNYDTTRYALLNLLGGLHFWGMEWAAILAFAFCGIDFAGLVRLFTPEQGMDEPKEVWFLTGAWLLGATMNTVMTWYAVSLAIAPRNVGVTLISNQDMLIYAPVFVAMLVWLTRILFIGSISFTAERLLHPNSRSRSPRKSRHRPARSRRSPVRANGEIETFQENFS